MMLMRKRPFLLFLLIPLLCLAGVTLYYQPPVHERLAWRLESLRTQVRYALNPPDQAVFIPQGSLAQMVQATLQALQSLQALTPGSSPNADQPSTPTLALPTPTWTQPGPTGTPLPTSTPTPTPTPLPESVYLTGIRHEWQSFNNCGPANLAMALSYWGWPGDQRDTRAYLRPHPDDYNVMPEEMLAYVETQTNLNALLRAGGDVDLLKRLLAAGFPVIIEMGHHPSDDWWMGHYVVVSGYDDAWGRFITQDSLVMADFPVPYADISERWWRDFNYLFLVIYPPEREAQLFELLGPRVDQASSMQLALEMASLETQTLAGRDLFFAWYNKGSSLAALGQYGPAAEAYDQAFTIYQDLPEKERPWRMGWYQTGPYQAYYYSGRYQDVIQLANTTLGVFAKPPLEESLYWRGLAKQATGDLDGAIADFKLAVDLNLTFTYGLAELERLGVIYP
jgi:tetratricopeptide (TPR) repeat protein